MSESSMLVPVMHLAKIFNVTDRRVQQLASDGIIPKAERGKYKFIESVQGYIQFLQDRAFGKVSSSIDSHTEKTRLLKVQADLLEIKYEKESAQILDIEEVEQAISLMLTILKKRIESIPFEIKETLEKSYDIEIKLDDIKAVTKSVLVELEENVPQFEPDDTESLDGIETDLGYIDAGMG